MTLEERLGYTFKDRAGLERALTHRSASNESKGAHNERLEFLGDAIVNFVVADLLYAAFPSADEGTLSRLRASAVNQSALAKKARALGIGARMSLGEGERKTGGADKDSLLADAYEAVVASIYLDGGMAEANAFLRRDFADDIPHLVADDPKTELQQHCQKDQRALPRYTIVSTGGPEHARSFVCEVHIGDVLLGRGEGRSKKLAEQAAARAALATLALRPLGRS